MNIDSIQNNAWFIALVSVLLGLAFQPIFSGLKNYIWSLFGAFSGIYIAITGHPSLGPVLVETVKCRHYGDRVSGVINGIAISEIDNGRLIEKKENLGKYKFNGTVDDRLLVISYQSTIREVKSAGTLTLHGDSSGKLFNGFWGGFEQREVVNAPCAWIRIKKSSAIHKNHEKIFEIVSIHINSGDRSLIYSDKGGVGKSSLFISNVKGPEETKDIEPVTLELISNEKLVAEIEKYKSLKTKLIGIFAQKVSFSISNLQNILGINDEDITARNQLLVALGDLVQEGKIETTSMYPNKYQGNF